MGNGYNNQHHHFHHHHHHHHKTTFLPFLCRTSSKDIKLPKCPHNTATVTDPSSPKVGCLGQVKRHNKVSGFPSSQHRFTATSTTAATTVKYTKLKKLFSSKSLTDTTAAAATNFRSKSLVIDVGELDPPLPVVKKVKEEVCIWKRRCNNNNGDGFKSLQIQQIQVPISHSLPPRTV